MPDMKREEEGGDRCEGCDAPAKVYAVDMTGEGMHFCAECFAWLQTRDAEEEESDVQG